MQAVVGCGVEDMKEQIGQPKLCWFCTNIVRCNPQIRPQCDCDKFIPFIKPTKKRIAAIIGISRGQLYYMIKNFGVEKVVERLEIRGYTTRYVVMKGKVVFCEVSKKFQYSI